MTMTNSELARTIAERAFADKTDKAGRPYVEHLERVANSAKEITFDPAFTDGDALKAVGWLHDILEDCPEWTIEHLRQIFGDEIADAVLALTKNKDQSYREYVERIKLNPLARLVKLADLKDNMDLSRLDKLTEKDVERVKKYHEAFVFLLSK